MDAGKLDRRVTLKKKVSGTEILTGIAFTLDTTGTTSDTTQETADTTVYTNNAGTTQTQNAYGEPVVQWTNIASVWARKLSSKGREFYSGGVTLSEGMVGIQIRRTPTVAVLTQLDVFVLEGVTYNIKSIDEVGRKDYLTIMGEAGLNNG